VTASVNKVVQTIESGDGPRASKDVNDLFPLAEKGLLRKQLPRPISEEVRPHESRHFSWLVFPDYELTDQTGKHRKLSDLQGPDPMILVLSRGGYCPLRIGARPRVC
jgi:hypothetical protein